MTKIGRNARVRAVRNIDDTITAGMTGTVYAKCGGRYRDVVWDDFIGGHDGEADDGSKNHWVVTKSDLEFFGADTTTKTPAKARGGTFETEFPAASFKPYDLVVTIVEHDGAPVGMQGIVVKIGTYVLCEFPGWTNGHTGCLRDGHMTVDRWWLPAEKIRPRKMVVEAGKRYIDRSGNVSDVISDDGTNLYSMTDGHDWWERDGRFIRGRIHKRDLVVEAPADISAAVSVKPTLAVEAGKFYRTADGRKAGPMRLRYLTRSDYPFVGDIEVNGSTYHYVWKPDGTNYEPETGANLVAEWADPPVARAASLKTGDSVTIPARVIRTRGDGNVIVRVGGARVAVPADQVSAA